MCILHAGPDIRTAKPATWGVGPAGCNWGERERVPHRRVALDVMVDMSTYFGMQLARRMHGIAGRAVTSGCMYTRTRVPCARAMKTRLGRRALNLAALQSRGDYLVGLGLERPSYL